MKRITGFLICTLLIFLGSGNGISQEREDSEMIVSFAKTEISLNPIHAYTANEAQIFTALYEGLVSYDPYTLDPVPAVARRWDISPDGQTYTFTLRENARYWNGDQVKAQHFLSTWLRLIDPEEKAEYASLLDIIEGAEAYRTGMSSDPDSVGIRALSDTKLQVTLTGPATHFLKVLCHHSFVPIHPLMLDTGSWSNYSSVPGNGPYYIVSRNKDEMILSRNELYWDKDNVSIPKLRFLFSDDAEATTQLYNKGRVDWIADVFDLEILNDRDSIIFNPLFATQYFFFSQKEKAWQNSGVRRALSLLLPWEEIKQNYFFPTETLVPRIPSYPQIDTDNAGGKEEALALLAEAGFPEGNGLPEVVITIPEEGVELRRMAAVMAATWKQELDLEIRIEPVPSARYFESLQSQDFTLATMTWIGDFADPLTFLQMWTSTSNLNDADYRNPEYDQLIRQSMSQTGEERYQTLGKAEEILIQGASVLPISHSPGINIINQELFDGWYENPLDIHPFKYINFARFVPVPGLVMKENERKRS